MEDNIVYVGSKPPMSYVLAIMTRFTSNTEGVVLRARGRAIPTAVDAAEITRNRFLQDITYDVSIGTEQMEGEEGRTRNVSTIEITLRKSPEALNRGGVS
jgi:DNA-binding protein